MLTSTSFEPLLSYVSLPRALQDPRHGDSFNPFQQFKIRLRVCLVCVPCSLLLFLASACHHRFCPQERLIISQSVGLLATDSVSFNFHRRSFCWTFVMESSPPLPTPSFRIVQMSFLGLLACVDFADKSAVSRLSFSLCSLSLYVYFHEFVFKYWFKFFKYNVVKFFPLLSLAPFPLYPSTPCFLLLFLQFLDG